ncbi:MAG TPA: hypothetical protein VNT25_00910 [Allosphingosinicella sp.]|nr:hypothetical protein [Allosphingosinicella sp.]
MNKLTRIATGTAASALVALSAAPAQAQSYPYPDNNSAGVGVDVGTIVRGVAVAGAAAAAVDAITRAVRGGGYGYPQGGYGYPQGGYGYPQGGYGYGYGEQPAVDACAHQAQRYGGRVVVTDVDRRGSSSYRVRGVIEPQYSNSTYNRGYERQDDYRERRTFSCTARETGQVTDFDTNRR